MITHIPQYLRLFAVCFMLTAIMSVNQWNKIPFGNTYIGWAVAFFMIFIVCFWGVKRKVFSNSEFNICKIYLLWLGICIVRGFFVAENYWEYKQLVIGSLALSMPLFVYFFQDPQNTLTTLRKWTFWMPLLFCLFFFWTISPCAFHFLLTPFLIYGCFLSVLSNKRKIIVLIVLMLMLFGDVGARAQMIKAAATILCAITFYYRNFVKILWLKIAHWLFYIIPIIFLILGATGTFNIFSDSLSAGSKKQTIKQKTVDGQVVNEDVAADTRTFIYREVISSAINNHYVILGRTPARGNDDVVFTQILMVDGLNTAKAERHSNELCHLNVFTWLGLIGLLLHCCIYLFASYRAVYFSNNRFLRFMGIMIAFNWALGWIENFTRFDIMNLTIWIMISMGLSPKFRQMTDFEFRNWFVSLFPRYI